MINSSQALQKFNELIYQKTTTKILLQEVNQIWNHIMREEVLQVGIKEIR